MRRIQLVALGPGCARRQHDPLNGPHILSPRRESPAGSATTHSTLPGRTAKLGPTIHCYRQTRRPLRRTRRPPARPSSARGHRSVRVGDGDAVRMSGWPLDQLDAVAVGIAEIRRRSGPPGCSNGSGRNPASVSASTVVAMSSTWTTRWLKPEPTRRRPRRLGGRRSRV